MNNKFKKYAGISTIALVLVCVLVGLIGFLKGTEVTVSFGNLEKDEIKGFTRHTLNLEDPSMEDSVFDGWFLDSSFKEEFKMGETKLTGNTTLYAKFTEYKKVTFATGSINKIDGAKVYTTTESLSFNTVTNKENCPDNIKSRFEELKKVYKITGNVSASSKDLCLKYDQEYGQYYMSIKVSLEGFPSDLSKVYLDDSETELIDYNSNKYLLIKASNTTGEHVVELEFEDNSKVSVGLFTDSIILNRTIIVNKYNPTGVNNTMTLTAINATSYSYSALYENHKNLSKMYESENGALATLSESFVSEHSSEGYTTTDKYITAQIYCFNYDYNNVVIKDAAGNAVKTYSKTEFTNADNAVIFKVDTSVNGDGFVCYFMKDNTSVASVAVCASFTKSN